MASKMAENVVQNGVEFIIFIQNQGLFWSYKINFMNMRLMLIRFNHFKTKYGITL